VVMVVDEWEKFKKECLELMDEDMRFRVDKVFDDNFRGNGSTLCL